MEIAKAVHKIYFPGCAFPRWVFDRWDSHDFDSVKVFYTGDEDEVKHLLMEREPCNISLKRLYNEEAMLTNFGYKQGAYRLSTAEKLMPNIAIYTHATVKLRFGFHKVHVINLIGAAFDHPSQPDFVYFKEKPISEVVKFYRHMWSLALAAMIKSPCKVLQIYNVGGGAFAGHFGSRFILEIFEPAFKPLIPLFAEKGLTVTGYDWNSHRFTAGYIPDCLEMSDLDSTMFVNAWDPWTLIGNGNERDGSLDGYWGRSSNMAVLGWLRTNPRIQFCQVEKI